MTLAELEREHWQCYYRVKAKDCAAGASTRKDEGRWYTAPQTPAAPFIAGNPYRVVSRQQVDIVV